MKDWAISFQKSGNLKKVNSVIRHLYLRLVLAYDEDDLYHTDPRALYLYHGIHPDTGFTKSYVGDRYGKTRLIKF